MPYGRDYARPGFDHAPDTLRGRYGRGYDRGFETRARYDRGYREMGDVTRDMPRGPARVTRGWGSDRGFATGNYQGSFGGRRPSGGGFEDQWRGRGFGGYPYGRAALTDEGDFRPDMPYDLAGEYGPYGAYGAPRWRANNTGGVRVGSRYMNYGVGFAVGSGRYG